MKIFGHGVDVERAIRDREQILDHKIQHLEDKLGLKSTKTPLSFEKKDLYLADLEIIQRTLAMLRKFALRDEPSEASFSGFTLLPFELRHKIWRLAFPGNDRPRIHVISHQNNRIISNQPLCPLLHVCCESRAYYIRSTKSIFAFGAYVNFARDTIYLKGFNTATEAEKLVEFNSNLSRTDESFLRFLECEHVGKIQKLAMDMPFFRDIPLLGTPPHKSTVLADVMPLCNEMHVVYDNVRSLEQCRLDVGMRFQFLSAKQQREGAQRSHTKSFAASLNSWCNEFEQGSGAFLYKYATVEKPQNIVSCSTQLLQLLLKEIGLLFEILEIDIVEKSH